MPKVLDIDIAGLKPETVQDLINHGYEIRKLSEQSKYPISKDWRQSVDACVACYNANINHNSPTFRKQGLLDTLHVELPMASQYFSLASIKKMGEDSEPLDISSVVHIGTWLDINWSSLDTSVGKKLYQITFEHTETASGLMTLYFGYIILDDNPDKPYIYMNKEV